jgi:hypothetical protein
MTKADAEVSAMATLNAAFAELDDSARMRVLSWANQKFGSGQASIRSAHGLPPDKTPADAVFADLPALYAEARPTSEPQRALVAGYWFQVCKKQSDFDSQSLNTELKQMGHGVSNITRALDELIKHRPQLVIQIKKSGTSKQARKRYRVTGEGIKAVAKLVAGKSAGTGKGDDSE